MEAQKATNVALYTLTEGKTFELRGVEYTVDENQALTTGKGRYVKVSGVDCYAQRTFYRATGGLHPRALSDKDQVFVEVVN